MVVTPLGRRLAWCNYFKHGVSKATFSYLGYFTWHRVARWVFRRHNRLAWKHIKRRFMIGWTFAADGIAMRAPAIWAAAVEPAHVPMVRSAVVTFSPASNRPAMTPISHALPVDPPPPRTNARAPAVRARFVGSTRG